MLEHPACPNTTHVGDGNHGDVIKQPDDVTRLVAIWLCAGGRDEDAARCVLHPGLMGMSQWSSGHLQKQPQLKVTAPASESVDYWSIKGII